MCWSWEVSLVFAVLQLISLSYIYYRNKYVDRYYIMMFIPVCIQEFIQFIIWKWGITDDTTKTSCNTANKISSVLLLIFVMTIGIFCSFFAYKTIAIKNNPYLWMKKFWLFMIVLTIIFYIFLIISELANITESEPYCTYVGDKGHLFWIHDIKPYFPGLEWIVFILPYVVPIGLLCILYKPLWVTLIPFAFIIITFFIFHIIYGTEGSSIWCWGASFANLWMLAYVPLARYLVKNEYINKDNIYSSCFKRQLFQSGYAHLARFDMMKPYGARDNIEIMVDIVGNKNNRKNKRICIIGAGPAGLHMASLFKKAGYKNVTILEKDERFGGKSLSIKDKPVLAKKEEQSVPEVHHELGTCYLSPEYHVIRELLKEYDPGNVFKTIESRDVIGVTLDGDDDDEYKTNINHNKIPFTDWALGRSEKEAVHERLHDLPDEVTGGISFFTAVHKYAAIHREIFGQQKENHLYGFLGKPSPENMKRINCTMMEFIKQEGLEALIPFLIYGQSMQGYGTLDIIPAYYGLFWNNPELLETVVDLWRLATYKPNIIILSKGFERLWQQMVQQLNMREDIKLNVTVKSINRHLNDPNKPIEISYHDPCYLDEIIEADYLFIACDMKNALNFLSDSTSEENQVFGGLSSYTITTTLYEADAELKNIQESVVELWPKVIEKTNGHLYGHRNTYKALIPNYNELVSSGKLLRERSVAYQFLAREQDENTAKELKETLLGDLETWGEKNVKIIRQEVWDYFHKWNLTDICDKHYPWKVRYEMQGKNKNTFYIGQSVCFEAVLSVVEYNNELWDQFGFAKN